ncbi:hypothetical protein ACFL02_03950 [Planctomycetota bacterium]
MAKKPIPMMYNWLIWTFVWLIYGTIILAIVVNYPKLLKYEGLTIFVGIIWVSWPILVYLYLRDKTEVKDDQKDDTERMKKFKEEMTPGAQLRKKQEKRANEEKLEK